MFYMKIVLYNCVVVCSAVIMHMLCWILLYCVALLDSIVFITECVVLCCEHML